MKYSIEITESAENDLFEIVDYISTKLLMPETALEQLKQIEIAIFKLETFPERNPVIKISSFENEGIRQVLVNNYMVFYQVCHSTVFILRVLYAKRDWLSLI